MLEASWLPGSDFDWLVVLPPFGILYPPFDSPALGGFDQTGQDDQEPKPETKPELEQGEKLEHLGRIPALGFN